MPQKAFDRVYWTFLHSALNQIGVGPTLLGESLALFSNPKAKVMTNGILSDPVHFANGTRQGCPLSPLLFIPAKGIWLWLYGGILIFMTSL